LSLSFSIDAARRRVARGDRFNGLLADVAALIATIQLTHTQTTVHSRATTTDSAATGHRSTAIHSVVDLVDSEMQVALDLGCGNVKIFWELLCIQVYLHDVFHVRHACVAHQPSPNLEVSRSSHMPDLIKSISSMFRPDKNCGGSTIFSFQISGPSAVFGRYRVSVAPDQTETIRCTWSVISHSNATNLDLSCFSIPDHRFAAQEFQRDACFALPFEVLARKRLFEVVNEDLIPLDHNKHLKFRSARRERAALSRGRKIVEIWVSTQKQPVTSEQLRALAAKNIKGKIQDNIVPSPSVIGGDVVSLKESKTQVTARAYANASALPCLLISLVAL
jgi:hypothetical protein